MPTRRSFIYQSVLSTAGLSLLGCGNSAPASAPEFMDEEPTAMNELPYLDTLGIQLWTVRNQMEADPVATLTALADIGYQQIELMDTRHIAELKPICDDLGLGVNSSFMLWTTLTGRWDLVPQETERFAFERVLEQAVEGGLSHLVFGYLQPGERETADDWKRRADELNVAGEKAKSAGLQLAYHNHNFEWVPVEGTTGFAILRERLEPELVPFELDLAWVAMAGQDASETLAAVGERTELVHIKNLVDLERPYLTIPEMPDDRFTELGAGQLDIPALMRQARELGATYCFYEQDNNWKPDALASARTSYAFLAT